MVKFQLLVVSLLLSGCEAGFKFGNPPAQIVVPSGEKVVEEPNGTVIAEPVLSPIETVITGMQQAQAVRVLTRQLAK